LDVAKHGTTRTAGAETATAPEKAPSAPTLTAERPDPVPRHRANPVEATAVLAQSYAKTDAPNRTVTPEKREQILRLRSDGKKYVEIAEIVGISKTTVGDIVRAAKSTPERP
jgi:DNA-directed RNA polymerase specialized sigma24 family protein